MLKLLRNLLGQLWLFFDWLTRPRRPKHSAEVQQKLDAETANMALYQFRLCPFCIKTRRVIQRLGLNIETRDALTEPHRGDLLAGGGEIKVPCLAITANDETRWMYESNDIIAYLEKRFS